MAYRSKGSGRPDRTSLAACGEQTVLEDGVRIFHPNHVFIGKGVYVGHDAMLEGHHAGELHIGAGSWIGAKTFINAAGNVHIGANVGIGPGVHILSSAHDEVGRDVPILHAPLRFDAVIIEDNADIGASAVLLPGVRVGRGAQVGAGAVVTKDVPSYAVVAGSPARILRVRDESE